MIRKLQLCAVIFDFQDLNSKAREKAIKSEELTDITAYINNYGQILQKPEIYSPLFYTVRN
jgi:hypothetical protein